MNITHPGSRGGSFKQEQVSYFQYEFIKSYFYGLFTGRVVHGRLKIIRILGRDSDHGYRLKPLSVFDHSTHDGNNGDSLPFVLDQSVNATVTMDGFRYEVMLYRIRDEFSDVWEYLLEVLGLDEGSGSPALLIQTVIGEALRHSPYRNRVLQVRPSEKRHCLHIDIDPVELDRTTLDDILLPVHLKRSLQVFVESVRQFHTISLPMRYLLNGEPGTAKTKIIRAIVQETKGLATVVMATGSDDRIDAIFNLAENFSPAIVCIDDVDLLVGNRQRDSERQVLGRFLQRLDGFSGSDVFVLATTNDKQLVDLAASRPGRFDMILDVPPIDPTDYLNLIRSKTDREDIVSLFNERVLQSLEARQVTGAFIATLVKHLEVLSSLNGGAGKADEEYLGELIDRLARGFYRSGDHADNKIGFLLKD